jgi:hypothetical protein
VARHTKTGPPRPTHTHPGDRLVTHTGRSLLRGGGQRWSQCGGRRSFRAERHSTPLMGAIGPLTGVKVLAQSARAALRPSRLAVRAGSVCSEGGWSLRGKPPDFRRPPSGGRERRNAGQRPTILTLPSPGRQTEERSPSLAGHRAPPPRCKPTPPAPQAGPSGTHTQVSLPLRSLCARPRWALHHAVPSIAGAGFEPATSGL